ncbi:aldehyde dehydrogenase family protein [Pseudomonas sp. GD03860]|uniref:aldehyde dehydrogenase family protein n=1 Tax=Pseudomonas TaxID=286 RepID=UPI0023637AD1|nr:MULTISPECIES: aldehyde dehydrogenase family protein [Pseudomonas]MDD2058455.1 aldehyde dehydrogenase family protein [Pseudomonas putida]MDH0640443.1 aldehyde dehydrogenase family protein [Pseudomonas sp. GD03860]
MSIDFTSQYLMTIDGQTIASDCRIEVINPATEDIIALVPDASADQLDSAVGAARRAFPDWAAKPLEERQALVRAIGERVLENLEGFAQLLTREQGKTLDYARYEIGASVAWFQEFARVAPTETIIEDSPEHLVKTRRVPIGVVGAIVPWNFPVLLAAWKLAPALVAGNTVVLKPSPFTPLTALKLGELINQLLPPGVVNVVSGGDNLGPWLTAHPQIDKISFTGSTATGRRVMESGSRNIKRITLELGGNDAAIVLPDVDIVQTAEKLFWGAFSNSGQFCLAIKRLFIHEDIYEPLVQALVSYARTVRIGDGSLPDSQLGPVQNALQFQRLKDLLTDIRDQDQRVLLGGEVPQGRGYFFPITLVDNPPDDSRVVSEEPFGPILPVLKYRDIDEVVARANSSEYGLGGSVWSKDVELATSIALRLQTGKVWVNEIHVLTPYTPLGGHKQSGLGVENGIDGLMEYTNSQTVSIRQS